MRVLLDSTYILPVFGIAVEGLSDDDIMRLRRLTMEGTIELFCVDVCLVEILGKVYKEYAKRGLDASNIVSVALRALFESDVFTWIIPPREAFELAFEMRKLGHTDMIDNILYATACIENMIFLSMDSSLVEFLRRNRLRTDNVVDHGKLFTMLARK